MRYELFIVFCSLLYVLELNLMDMNSVFRRSKFRDGVATASLKLNCSFIFVKYVFGFDSFWWSVLVFCVVCEVLSVFRMLLLLLVC